MRSCFALACFVFAVQSAAAQDTLKFRDTKHPEYKGNILSFSYKTVEFEMEIGGTLAAQQVAAKDIKEILFDPNNKSSDYFAGETAMNRNDFVQAAERFEKAMAARNVSDVMRQAAAIQAIQCHTFANNIPKALAGIQALRKDKPETYYLRDTYDYEYRCNLAQNNTNAANKTLLDLEQKSKDLKMPEWARDADFMRADVLERQGKWREALAIHKKYLNDRDAATNARLGELRCLTRLKEWPTLKTRAEALMASAKGADKSDDMLLMAAHNAMGEVDLEAGNPKEGMMHFLRGALVLNRGGETSPEHEAALAGAVRACAKLASTIKDKPQKDECAGRARELMEDLKRAYSDSPLLAEAAKAIQEIK